MSGRRLPNVVTGRLLTSASYAHTTTITSTQTGANLDDVNASNLVVSFVVPPSGAVIVSLSAVALCAIADNYYTRWGVNNGSTTVAEARVTAEASATRHACRFKVTGLTPGTATTWKWGHGVSAAGTTTLYSTSPFGAALMEIYAA